MKVNIFSSNNNELNKWERYYNRLSSKGVYHRPKYIKTIETHYRDPAELFILEYDDNNFIYYPYFKRSLSSLPFAKYCDFDTSAYFDIVSSWYYGGPILEGNNESVVDELVVSFGKAFSEYCRASNIVSEFIRFDPYLKNHSYFEKLFPISKNRDVVYVDLKQTEDDIFQSMEGRCRTAIRKALKLGVKVRMMDRAEDINDFYEIYVKEMERKKALSHYFFDLNFISLLFEQMSSDIKLIIAELDGITVSGGIFVREPGQTVHYFLMATDYNYRQYRANNLILYEAILFFKKDGVKIFDLQGGREGVYKFKKSFSKNRAAFFTSGMVHNRPVYEELVRCREKYILSEDTEFFPLYRLRESN